MVNPSDEAWLSDPDLAVRSPRRSGDGARSIVCVARNAPVICCRRLQANAGELNGANWAKAPE